MTKDLIKETLHDALYVPGDGEIDQAWSQRLGSASFVLLWTLAARAGDMVIEANFHPHSKYERDKLRGLGDPDSCTFEIFALEQVATADYDKRTDVKRQHFDDYSQADLGDVFMQDMGNVRGVTVGMHSPSYDGHRLSEVQEMTIYNHHRVADRYIFRED